MIIKTRDDFLVIGFTGAFCSGCTTAADFFNKKLNEEKLKLVGKKDEIDSGIAECYKKFPIISGGKETDKKKEILKLLKERQVINVFKKVSDESFFYISLTDMMNSIMIRYVLNNNEDNISSQYKELCSHIIEWCKNNELTKDNVMSVKNSIDNRDTNKYDEVSDYLKKLRDFREYLHNIYKDQNKIHDLFFMMQDIGNNLRKCGKPFADDECFIESKYLPIMSEEATSLLKFDRSCKKITSTGDTRTYYIIECFRNPAEVEYLRRRFYEFYLFSVFSEEKNRFQRASNKYKLTSDNCIKIDERDQGGDYLSAQYKQNVKKCVSIADISVTNNTSTLHDYYRIILKYYALIKAPGCFKPTHTERNMHIAYSMSLNSTCISRQVGAVIVKNGNVIGTGWNDTEKDRLGCIYRLRSDTMRNDNSAIPLCPDKDYTDFFNTIHSDSKALDHAFCYKDEYGKFKKQKTVKQKKLPPECESVVEEIETRSLQQCRALHAEENAILQTSELGGVGLDGATIYTTTFPCELCAKKIMRVGIERIVYCEPYPKSVSMDVFFKESIRKIESN